MIHWLYMLAAAVASFVLLVVIFRPMELVFPARKDQPFLRRHFALDLCFFLGQYLLWYVLVNFALGWTGTRIHNALPGGYVRLMALQPWWLQVLEVVLVSDFLIYWGHRLQHSVGFLWRFHAVHHSSEHLDWLAAHREHPLDSIYTVSIINLPAVFIGLDMTTVAGLVAFRGIWAIYIHSNVRLPLGALRWFIGAPELHHWHHDKDRRAGNYANISPLMDLLFGTYRCPDKEPESFGLQEPSPRTYAGHLIKPLLPAKAWNRVSSEWEKRWGNLKKDIHPSPSLQDDHRVRQDA